MKPLMKSLLRHAIYARLQHLPRAEAKAAWWAEAMKRWPGLFHDKPFRADIIVDHGAQMRVGLIDVIERSLFVGRTWDRPVGDCIRSLLEVGDQFVDVGANIGYFSLMASRLVGPAGKVLAIEPSHRNLSRLAEHLWLNRAENVVLASMAVGNHAGLAKVSFPTYNNAGAATLRAISTVQAQTALQVPLDDLIERAGLSPNVVKLDIEGFEFEALKGLTKTLRLHRPVVICELTPKFLAELDQSADALVAFMRSLGYQCIALTESDSIPVGSRLDIDGSRMPAGQMDVAFHHGE